jgi:hypothetical protein
MTPNKERTKPRRPMMAHSNAALLLSRGHHIHHTLVAVVVVIFDISVLAFQQKTNVQKRFLEGVDDRVVKSKHATVVGVQD